MFFFFNDTATTEIYTLSLHDALPIFDTRIDDAVDPGHHLPHFVRLAAQDVEVLTVEAHHEGLDRKSTRLNSSHANISYAVFCLKKKKNNNIISDNAIYSDVST